MRKILTSAGFTMVGAFLGAGMYAYFFSPPQAGSNLVKVLPSVSSEPTFSNFYSIPPEITIEKPDFILAANTAKPCVVHIRSTIEPHKGNISSRLLDFFKGDSEGEEEYYRGSATGSGVVITPDGYIATNFHVIKDASLIEVTLNDNRTYQAEIIGSDINTDLALLKISETKLNYLSFGNPDKVQIGEWVLAIGNPLNYNTTVTAGIISAKGRNLGLLNEDSQYAVESFIQTDAVVNRGNSGGALVNLKGELIGINTAISSRSGYFEGYSFAIPATIAKKVLEDLLKFKEVKRALLGVVILPVNSDLAKREHLGTLNGAYVQRVSPNSGAADAGLKKGDVIVSVNGASITNSQELQEQVSRYRPGEQIQLKVYRGEKEMNLTVTLKSIEESDGEEASESFSFKDNVFSPLSANERYQLGIRVGIKLESVSQAWKNAGLRKGLIILEIDGNPIHSMDDLKNALESAEEVVLVKGIYSTGKLRTFELPLSD